MIPIVVILSENALEALNELVTNCPPPPEAWQIVMHRNGWTEHAVIAGDLIAYQLGIDALPDPDEVTTP
jgi:hypothetical protein